MSKLRTNEIAPFSSPGIGVGGPPVSPSAMWDFQSTTQGILPPRMTTVQRDAIASPVEGLLIYNLDDGRLEQYTSGQWTVVGNGLTPIKNVLRVVKNTILNSDDFSSINAALATISDNSLTNQYVIEVGPGVFIENPIHMKPYVYIKGQDFDATVIQANDPTEHLIFACDFSSVSTCLLTGVTVSGKALIYYASTVGTMQTAFWAEDVRFGASDTLAIADGTLAHSNLFINSGRYGGIFSFNTGFIARTSGSFTGRVVIRNSTSSKMTAPYPTDMFVCDGLNCEINLKSVVARTGVVAGGGTGLRIRNGGTSRIASLDLAGWTKGLWIENVGATPLFLGGILLFESNTIDVQVDHPSTLGGMGVGADDDNKIIINPSAVNFGFIILGIEDGDIVVSGKVKQNQVDGTFTDVSTLVTNSSPLGILVNGDINPPISGTTVTVEAGMGYLQKSDGSLRKIIWPDTPITLPSHSINYLYFDQNSVLQHSSISPNPFQNIIIGRAVTNNGDMISIEESGLLATHAASNIGIALRDGLGPVYVRGSAVSEVSTRNLQVSPGSYYYGERNFLSNGGNPITFDTFYQDGLGDTVVTENVTQVDNTKWDDGTGTLASLTSSYYARHALYALGDSTNDFDSEAYFFVYSQAEYSALVLAEAGNLPVAPPYLSEAVVLIASIIVQQGTTNIVEIRDERPVVGFKASGISAAAFHSGLLGLTVGDDHPQYWRNDGTHLATGDFNLNTHDITNLGTANGVVVENHEARHLPTGADPLTTAAPLISLSATTLNIVGTANSLARSDHGHAILTGTPSTQTPDQSNATGTSANLARADHIHNIPTAAPITTLSPATTNAHGSAATFALSDHAHAIATSLVGDITSIQAGIAAGAGIVDKYARGDHKHSISTATVSGQTPDQSSAEGLSSSLARADHVHNIPAAIAVSIGASNAKGSAASFALSDHVHQGMHSIAANGGSQRFGDQNLKNGNGVTVVDDGGGNFTFDTISGPNELYVTTGAGLVANYTTGKVRFDGTFTQVAASSITLTASQTNGRIYVDTDGTVKQTAGGISAPPYTVVLAIFTTSVSAITALTDHRTFLDQNIIRGLSGDIVTIVPNASAAQGSTNKLADAGHAHAIATATAVGLDANSTSTEGAATSFARSNHTHAIASGTVSTQTPDQVNAAGTSTNFARADHIHDIPAAIVSALTTASTTAKGSAASFALSDHVHAVTVKSSQATATSSTTNASATDALLNSMTLTPSAGVYLAIFTSSCVNSANGAQRTFVSLYFNGSQEAESEISVGTAGGAYSPVATQTIITADGTHAIEARARVAGGTTTFQQRVLTLIRLSN